MFGYIKPHAPELKVSAYELYRSTYCALCRAAGKRVSFLSRLFLSYDYVYLAVSRLFLTGEDFEVGSARCFYQPCKKHAEMRENGALRYSAAAFAFFTHYKIKDNIADSPRWKRIAYRICALLTSHFEKKAQRLFPEMKQSIDTLFHRLRTVEARDGATPDEAAALFGDMMAAILSAGMEGDQRAAAQTIGFQTGRYIYLCDALDDLDTDEKNGGFNPFLSAHKSARAAREYATQNQGLLLAGMMETGEIYSRFETEETCKSRALREICINIAQTGSRVTLQKILEERK